MIEGKGGVEDVEQSRAEWCRKKDGREKRSDGKNEAFERDRQTIRDTNKMGEYKF